ncbi:MAG TPA: sigma-54 dependent transcriptional regulator [Myxococcota bacterium]|nr:sigma-54 dependent transcriptional regulator [Myxococcota bacterium]
MSSREALFVDVGVEHAAALAGWCARSGLRVVEAKPEAVTALDRRALAVVVVELVAAREASFEWLRGIAKGMRGVPIVVLGRGLTGELGHRLARMGVVEVVDLPAAPMSLCARVGQHVLDPGASPVLTQLVGQSLPTRQLRQAIQEAGRVDSKVLLQGETGTGKGLVARLIHEHSHRRAEPFVHVDCAALSPTLIESELFGHEKNAFTGAAALRRGRFEVAGRGTIFLDEIGDLDGPLQSKLLRVLEDRLFERVGGSQSIPMTARVIAATCHDLVGLVRAGRFRADLFFRLNVIEIVVPPLRHRLDDIPALTAAGVERFAESIGIPSPEIDDSFYERLCQHTWPGNVRELLNVIERVLARGPVRELMAEDLDGLIVEVPPPGPIGPSALPATAGGVADAAGREKAPFRTAEDAPDLTLEERLDAERIATALHATGGNVSRVSRRLELARGTLRHRIRKYRLEYLIQKD